MTSIANDPIYRLKQLLSGYGYLSGFTITETSASFSAPVFQLGYPDETASNVSATDSILAVQHVGGNSNTFYHQDINVRLHLWTPTNGSSVHSSYRARFSEIINGLKSNWGDGGFGVMTSSFSDSGMLDSGRYVFTALIRVAIGDTD